MKTILSSLCFAILLVGCYKCDNDDSDCLHPGYKHVAEYPLEFNDGNSPILSGTLTQISESNNTTGSTLTKANVTIVNAGQQKLDSFRIAILTFKSAQHLADEIIFAPYLYFQNTALLPNQCVGELNIYTGNSPIIPASGFEAILLNRYSGNSFNHKFSGLYEGSFSGFKNGTLTTESGTCIGYIAVDGRYCFFLNTAASYKAIQGQIATQSLPNGKAYAQGNLLSNDMQTSISTLIASTSFAYRKLLPAAIDSSLIIDIQTTDTSLTSTQLVLTANKK